MGIVLGATDACLPACLYVCTVPYMLSHSTDRDTERQRQTEGSPAWPGWAPFFNHNTDT